MEPPPLYTHTLEKAPRKEITNIEGLRTCTFFFFQSKHIALPTLRLHFFVYYFHPYFTSTVPIVNLQILGLVEPFRISMLVFHASNFGCLLLFCCGICWGFLGGGLFLFVFVCFVFSSYVYFS